VSGARLLVGPGRRAGRALRLRCAMPTSASAPGVRRAVRAAAVVGCAAAVAPCATSSERRPQAVQHAAAPPSGAVAAVAVLVARRALAAAAAAPATTALAASAALATTPAALFAPTRADELVQRQVQPRGRRRRLHAGSKGGRRERVFLRRCFAFSTVKRRVYHEAAQAACVRGSCDARCASLAAAPASCFVTVSSRTGIVAPLLYLSAAVMATLRVWNDENTAPPGANVGCVATNACAGSRRSFRRSLHRTLTRRRLAAPRRCRRR
jgi:hypothetical protein